MQRESSSSNDTSVAQTAIGSGTIYSLHFEDRLGTSHGHVEVRGLSVLVVYNNVLCKKAPD